MTLLIHTYVCVHDHEYRVVPTIEFHPSEYVCSACAMLKLSV